MAHSQIFVNLPVADLARSRAFFTRLGYRFNEQFSNDKAACLVLGENLFVMLLTFGFFQGFTRKPIANAKQSTEMLLCLSCDSREEVDRLVALAVAGGAKTPNPVQDHGFMYAHGFEDLDGHQWELTHMVEMPAES
jgi:predicted lactoylglutathione lyase